MAEAHQDKHIQPDTISDDPQHLKETIASYDANARAYVARNQQAGWWVGTPRNFKRLTPYLPARAKILDVGCGPGHDVANWRLQGAYAWGMDLSFGMLIESKPHAEGYVAQADMRHLPFASSTWDAIWMSASLLHIPRPQAPQVMRDVARILRVGGHVCLSVKEGDGEAQTHHLGTRYFVYYRAEALDKLIHESGLVIVDRWQQTPNQQGDAWLGVVACKRV